MRITTQMLNETARKTGIPINDTSLLNHIYNNGSGNSLLNVLNKGGNSAADAKQKNSYEKLEKTAGQLQKRADSLAAKGRALCRRRPRRAAIPRRFARSCRRWRTITTIRLRYCSQIRDRSTITIARCCGRQQRRTAKLWLRRESPYPRTER